MVTKIMKKSLLRVLAIKRFSMQLTEYWDVGYSPIRTF